MSVNAGSTLDAGSMRFWLIVSKLRLRFFFATFLSKPRPNESPEHSNVAVRHVRHQQLELHLIMLYRGLGLRSVRAMDCDEFVPSEIDIDAIASAKSLGALETLAHF